MALTREVRCLTTKVFLCKIKQLALCHKIIMDLSLNQGKLIETSNIEDKLFIDRDVSLSMLRIDTIDKVISGNKLFKLTYYLEDAINSHHKKVISFGGAYSNHLAATALACKINAIEFIGLVPGVEPLYLSHTLQGCIRNGMQLKFIARRSYGQKESNDFNSQLLQQYGHHTLIPEGGFGPLGVQGASNISKYIDVLNFTHVCLPVGSGTTIAGIRKTLPKHIIVIGFTPLSQINDIESKICLLLNQSESDCKLINHYHFGGFGKFKADQLSFMNRFYSDHGIATDFVYTGKMMFGIFDLIRSDYFGRGSKILCIHTGGLQGNISLPEHSLCF